MVITISPISVDLEPERPWETTMMFFLLFSEPCSIVATGLARRLILMDSIFKLEPLIWVHPGE